MNIDMLTLAKRISRWIIPIFVIISCFYWMNRTLNIVYEPDNEKFSNNNFSGVRLSRNSDMRTLNGRASGTIAYSDYLVAATNFISTSKSGHAPFVDQRFRPYSDSELGFVELKEVSLIPKTKRDQFFGVQSLTKFKLSDGFGAFSVGLSNKWIRLSDSSNNAVVAYLEKIDEDSIVWVRGDIPLWFYPNKFNLLGSQVETESAVFHLYTELTNAIRGGVVITKGGDVVYVKHLPILRNLPFVRKFRYRPKNNDILQLGAGEKYTIKKVLFVHDGYFLELDRPITPYSASNNDLVNILQRSKDKNGPMEIKISSESSKDFWRGREKLTRLNFDFTDIPLSKDDYVMNGYKGNRYYVSSIDGNEVAIDLYESVLFNICSNLDNRRIQNELTKKSDKLIKSAAIDQKCGPGSMGRNLAIKFLNKSKFNSYSNDFFGDYLKTKHTLDVISIDEVFSRSLDMRFYYSCRLCNTSASSYKAKNLLPKVYGNGLIWETYPGSMLNIFFESLNPAEPELMIHAIGKDLSNKYYKKFETTQPSYVAFANPKQFTPWLYTTHWPFFESLLINYKQFYLNSDFSLWYRANKDWVVPKTSWEGNYTVSGEKEISLPIHGGEGMSVYSVLIKYKVNNRLSNIPLLGTSPRLYVRTSNANTDFPFRPPVSLPLNETEFTFPIFVKGNDLPKVTVDMVDPLQLGATYQLKSFSWRKVPVASSEVENLLFYATPFRLLKSNE